MSERLLIAALAVACLAACGQTGPLYLPESQGEVVTRPTQTPPEDAGGSASSPQSVDSPPAPATPAPEVTAPRADDEEKEDEDGARKSPGSI